jgi:hypothetical protein
MWKVNPYGSCSTLYVCETAYVAAPLTYSSVSYPHSYSHPLFFNQKDGSFKLLTYFCVHMSIHLSHLKYFKLKILWHVCRKSELWSQQKQQLVGNGSANTPVHRQWLNSRQVMATTDTDWTIEELFKAVFSVRPVLGLYKEGQLPLRERLETAVRRVGGWCEMAASLRGREPGGRGTSTVGRRYQAAHWRPWLRTLASVWQWSVKCSHELY